MKLFRGEEALIQEIDTLQPSICTPLGTIEFLLSVSNECYFPTDCFRLKQGGFFYQYQYESFDCELVICKPKLDFASQQAVEECWGAVFRIKPNINYSISTCRFSAFWQEGYNWEDYGSNTGEDLEAIEYENENYRLHLGTQDAPLLIARRDQGDMIPKSLCLNTDFEKYGFIISSDKGIEVPMTPIDAEETCQIHFVIAWNRNIEEDVSTWLAVDLTSKQILKREEIW
ncbi:hypothetical protein [Paenibacillus sp. 1781tsa1]|uniref:hypothetical protein n=1 Tax=Paenibacillus sp. 1781tsa1 TaxID=2953810 RepID=UPI0020A211DA|nr:hypothetical protein [Paenibacillus sp. 1781tsa1]MCP1183709.1 hypothetical protein [Paenibacillus sp. 1781tsa1]